jgi:uncharacterized membrane protein YedE/YeeE
MHLAGFDLIGGLGGGLLIGVASSSLLYLTGKITGISGIIHSAVAARNVRNLFGWRFSYLLGLATSGVVLMAVKPSVFQASNLRPLTGVLAGLLVGYGTRLGGGCTSGHGVCGLPRLSIRSLAGVLTFMATGAMTASISRSDAVAPYLHQAIPFSFTSSTAPSPYLSLLPTVFVIIASALAFHNNSWLHNLLSPHTHDPVHVTKKSHEHGDAHHTSLQHHAIAAANGLLFGLALGFSGMTNPNRVQGFLDFAGRGGWDPTLMFVMGGAVMLNLVTFYWMKSQAKPFLSDERPLRDIIAYGMCEANQKIDSKLLLGSAIFGYVPCPNISSSAPFPACNYELFFLFVCRLGWGLGGFCPGPAIVSLGAGSQMAGIIVPSMLAGMTVYEVVQGGGLFHHRPAHHGEHKHHEAQPKHQNHSHNASEKHDIDGSKQAVASHALHASADAVSQAKPSDLERKQN